MRLLIKNMVCARCIRTVSRLANEAGLATKSVQLGEIQLDASPMPVQLAGFRTSLEREGFDLLDDRASRLVEQVKMLVIREIHHAANKKPEGMNFSDFLARAAVSVDRMNKRLVDPV